MIPGVLLVPAALPVDLFICRGTVVLLTTPESASRPHCPTDLQISRSRRYTAGMKPWEETWDTCPPYVWRSDPLEGNRLHNIVRVCDGENPDEEEDPEQQDRLNLMAASPDLYRALNAMLTGQPVQMPDGSWCSPTDLARAAMAKAEGIVPQLS